MNAKPRPVLLLSASLPPAAVGSGIVVQNLLARLRRDEVIALGPYCPWVPSVPWPPDRPRVWYGMLQPPFDWRGERWAMMAQWPLFSAIALGLLLAWRCTCIVVVYPFAMYLLTGYLASVLTGRPLLVYMHNTYLENLPHSRLARWLQPRVFRRATVLVLTEAMQDSIRASNPGLTTHLLRHSLDDALIGPELASPPPVHEPLRLAFAGNINDSCAEAASRMLDLVTRDRKGLSLRVFSGMSREALARCGVSGPNMSVACVPYDRLVPSLAEGDIILHPHGFSGRFPPHEYETMFPTKTLEYLVCGRPILAHAPGACYLARFYRENDCALLVDEPSVKSLESALERLRGDAGLRLRLVNNALQAARQFSASGAAERFREFVRQMEKQQ